MYSFSTCAVARHERLDSWRHAVAEVFAPLDIRPCQRGDFLHMLVQGSLHARPTLHMEIAAQTEECRIMRARAAQGGAQHRN